MIACPKCALAWEPNCEQTRCIERFGECIRCRFVKRGPYNEHGSGEGTESELTQIALRGARMPHDAGHESPHKEK